MTELQQEGVLSTLTPEQTDKLFHSPAMRRLFQKNASDEYALIWLLSKHMKDSGIGYGSVNHPVDRDPVCGYNGIIGDECPNCHRREDGRPFERIRRITGYLVGTLDRFNNAKRAEERDRVKHGVSGTEA